MMKNSSSSVRSVESDNDNETSPLIPGGTRTSPDHLDYHHHHHHHGENAIPAVHHHHPSADAHALKVVVIVTTMIFLLCAGDFMNSAPRMRFLEDRVCRQYYASSPNNFNLLEPIPEERCKVPDVQAKLAMLKGWDQTFSCVPSIIMAVPYGAVADKYGRRIVLALNFTGVILMGVWVEIVAYFPSVFDVRWFWAGNVFFFLGGGGQVTRSLLFTVLADVVTEERRANTFFKATAAGLASTIVGIPLSWQLMKRTSLFVPMSIGLGTMSLSALLILLLPETLNRSKVPDLADDVSSSDTDSSDEGGLLTSSKKKTFISAILRKVEDSRFMFTSPMLCALAVTFLVQSMHGISVEFLLQFASERFHWSLGNSSLLIPLSSMGNFLILVAIFPVIYSLLTTKFGLHATVKDLIVTRGSIFFNIFGALLIAISPHPSLLIIAIIFYSFGNGFSSAARSLITSLVKPSEVSRLFAILAIFDTIGMLVSGPLLSKAYSWGLHIGGLWSGMAFIFVAGLYAVTCLPILLFKLPEIEIED